MKNTTSNKVTVKNTSIETYYAPSPNHDSPYVVAYYQTLYDNNTGLMLASKPMSNRFDDDTTAQLFVAELGEL